VTGAWRVTRKPFTDSIPGNQQFRENPDSSLDFIYKYPGRIPLVMLDEEIHTGWDGRVYPTAPRGWQQASAHCEPYIYTWLQQKELRSTRGSFDALSGSVIKTLPNTNHRIRVIWSLQGSAGAP
jgi:hypothetical protein